jgi:hypothetical protein
VGVLGLVASVPAAARRVSSPNLELVGSLTFAWQGDPARGCAAAGLCDVRGSLELVPSGGFASAPGPPSIELIDPGSAARVIDQSPSATATACADPVPVDVLFAIRRSHATPDQNLSIEPPSAGRCAGPTAADLLAVSLPARRLGRHGYDLSGDVTFGAGPFTVTATSSLRTVIQASGPAIVGTSTSGSISAGPVPPRALPRPLLSEHADAVYRIAATTGSFTTTFSGLAPPLCDPLGACGTSGALHETAGTGGTVRFSGARVVSRRVGARKALADLRAGRLGFGFSGSPISGTLSETLTQADGTTCADTDMRATPLMQAPGPASAIALGPGAFPFGGPDTISDPLRTRCPGPSARDILGRSALATATVPMNALGDRRLTLTFAHGNAGSFVAGDYAGERTGTVVLTLVLVRASAGTVRTAPFPPIPPRLP